MIRSLGEKLNLAQRVIATAQVYFKRLYKNNSLKDCDPHLAVPACILLASKIEECAVNCKRIMKALRKLTLIINFFKAQNFPYEMKDILQFECFLLEELDFYLTVFHPYKSLDM